MSDEERLTRVEREIVEIKERLVALEKQSASQPPAPPLRQQKGLRGWLQHQRRQRGRRQRASQVLAGAGAALLVGLLTSLGNPAVGIATKAGLFVVGFFLIGIGILVIEPEDQGEKR